MIVDTTTAVTPLKVDGKPVPTVSKTGKSPAAAKPAKVNVGYNVQTAVGPAASPEGVPAWLLGLTGLFAAGSGVVLWRGGVRFRNTAV